MDQYCKELIFSHIEEKPDTAIIHKLSKLPRIEKHSCKLVFVYNSFPLPMFHYLLYL